MRPQLLTILVAALAGSASSIGMHRYLEKPRVVQVVNSPAPVVSQAKAERASKVIWPELRQDEVDALTAALKQAKAPLDVTVYCYEDAKCEDLALSLENAFETAHWKIEIRTSPMAPFGVLTSSPVLLAALRTATALPIELDVVKNAGPGEYIVIGPRK